MAEQSPPAAPDAVQGQTVVSTGPAPPPHQGATVTVQTGNGGASDKFGWRHWTWSKSNILLLILLFGACLWLTMHAAHHRLDAGVIAWLQSLTAGFSGAMLSLMTGDRQRKTDETTSVSVPAPAPPTGIPGHCPGCSGQHGAVR